MHATKTHKSIKIFGSIACAVFAVAFMGVQVITTQAAITKKSSVGKASVAAALVSLRNQASSTADVTVPAYTLENIATATGVSDFVVGPGKIELTMAPGQSQTIDLTISNRIGMDKSFSITEEDFTGSDNANQPVVLLGDDRGPYSLRDYIHIPDSIIPIPNSMKARLPITVSIPENAQPGGLYGSVIVSVASSKGKDSPTTGSTATNPIITRIGTLFFVRVAGSVKEEGQLSAFSLAGNAHVLTNSDPVVFDLYYHNTGNVHLDPHGTITVTNMFGATVGSIDADPWFAMPQSLRFREVTWTPPFLFGRYDAHASIARGYGSTTDEMDIVFWVIPWKIILIIFIGLVIFIALIRFVMSRFTIVTKKSSSKR